MGTWDVGPFDNDTAGDFCDALDAAATGERERIIRDTLLQAIGTVGCLDAPASEEAVAAADLVAAQCPDSDPADPDYGPEQPLPDLTGLRSVAAQALARVMSEPSELMELWDRSHGGPWRATVDRLQRALLPQPPGEQLRLV
ncbi:DUF4259 domain-containing protein [Streptomyces jumonjinensis]|uniref:DUF4259 domain-containing protein n=1 Tax=Streptomyces jumonjinensis TaxID=1945 RepID=UPI0037AD7A8F